MMLASVDAMNRLPNHQLVAEGASAAARPLVIRTWLWWMCGLIAAMVVVGGATRLTDSGLSITEWKPLLGAIPPLTTADWMVAFEKYRQIPEYQLVNKGMSLAEFQFIYWWEWGHRQLGRFIGIAYAVPLAIFWIAGWIPAAMKPRLLLFLVLGGMQGAMGWYMVQSGLADRVDVSQYRLAAHLGLAFALFAALFWTALALTPNGFFPGRNGPQERAHVGARAGDLVPSVGTVSLPAWIWWSAIAILALTFAQTLLGALVAGMKAGLAYNTWPLMNGALIPQGLGAISPWWLNPFENALTVQFDHRIGAYLLLGLAVAHAAALWRSADALFVAGPKLRETGLMLLVVIVGQALIGIATLLAQVPIHLGLLHQAGALAVVAACLWHLHVVRRATAA